MKRGKQGVLLINLGTPDSYETADVRKYLREFLMDRRVIDIPYFRRWMLVNGIIAPTRAPKSAEIYKEVWTDEGSPLLVYGQRVKELLQQVLGNEYLVALGMRYGNPSIKEALEELRSAQVSEITVIPLYPQYASATTGSTIEKLNEELSTWELVPSLHIVSQFLEHPLFVKAFAEVGRKYLEEKEYDHILFSYHGLPERQILKASCDNYCQLNDKCCSVYHSKNQFCYRAQCYQTTRLLAEALNIPEEKYSVCFQSRLGKTPWIQPYIEDVVPELPKQGKKKVLAFSPAFVADCLETTIEIGEEFKEEFLEAGGEEWQLVESLNDNPLWIDCLKALVLGQ